MPFCGECGNKLEPGTRFCGECGAKQEVSKPAPKPVKKTVYKSSTPKSSTPKSRTPKSSTPKSSTTYSGSSSIRSSKPDKTDSRGLLSAGEELDTSPEDAIMEKKFKEAHDKVEERRKSLVGSGGIEQDDIDYDSMINSSEYKLKKGSRGIVKHITKLWHKGVKDDKDKDDYEITMVHQYLASVDMMNDYQKFLNKCEASGHHLRTKAKRITTAQCWYVPSSQDQIHQIFKFGFNGIYSVAFYRDPVQAIKEEDSKIGVLMQCRVALVRYNERRNKVFLDDNQGALPAFLVDFEKK